MFYNIVDPLNKNQQCPHCGAPMKWAKSVRSADGARWRCYKRSCPKELSIRHGSFFAKSRLPLKVRKN